MTFHIKFFSLLLLSLSLQGCAQTALSGAQLAYNHYSLQNTLHDNYTTMHVNQVLQLDRSPYKDFHIQVNTFNNELLLTGQISSNTLRQQLTAYVKNISDVETIYNYTTIDRATTTLTRMEDMWIATKISSQLMTAEAINAAEIKVVTENHVVYFMGIVTPQQGKIAIDIAEHTQGVNRVVDLFSYIVKLRKKTTL